MLMASQVIAYLATFIEDYGDVPCVIEHKSSVRDGILLDPVNDVAIMSIGRSGLSHIETCAIFTERQTKEKSDNK